MQAITSHPKGAEVLIAVRPEKIVLSSEPVPGAVKGTIAASAYLGERNHINVMVGGLKEPVSVAEQNRGHSGPHHAAGDVVYLSWQPDAVVILPQD